MIGSDGTYTGTVVPNGDDSPLAQFAAVEYLEAALASTSNYGIDMVIAQLDSNP
jgi:hypothetical protein